jgi:peroxiredoxin
MKPIHSIFPFQLVRRAAATLALMTVIGAGAIPGRADEVPNFALLDVKGRYFELHRTPSRAVLLFFTGNGCPVARQCVHKLKELRESRAEKDLSIWMVDSVSGDDRESILKEAYELGAIRSLPFLKDDTQGVARAFGVSRTGTAVLISTKEMRVIYKGAVDDQLSEGASKPEAAKHYLDAAIRECLAGKPVPDSETASKGCLITFEGKLKGGDVSYSRDVAPLLEKHCFGCHSPGNIGPFAMSNYQKVKSKSAMIQEVVLSRRMPPWSADTAFGHFHGERTMTLDETRTLLAWIGQGSPRGDGEDPLAELNPPARPKWPLGQPDFVVKIPAQEVAATGVLEYRHIKIDAPVTDDSWLRAVAIHPGNLKVVHHCIARARHGKTEDDGSGRGVWLQGWAPGISAEAFPENTGRLLRKGSELDIEMHYTTMGSPQTDETEIGFYTLPAPPKMRLENHPAANVDFSIPPGDENAQTFAACPVKEDSLLFSLAPHMHLRGSWMRYEALYPSGKRETLLSVPHYDFNWQTGYILRKPKKMPAGSWILCSGGFDNSASNPSNPDPAKRVAWGDQSFEEMFIGFMEMAEIPRNQTNSASPVSSVPDQNRADANR